MRINAKGQVGIGTSTVQLLNSGNYKLFVKDGIRTEKVKVDIASSNGWADYVFEPEYDLMPLEDLAKFVATEKHLPKMPSEKELQTEGMDLAEMDKIQMEKIEELTLYVLQLQK